MAMVTIYTVTTPAPVMNGRPIGTPVEWRGDCPAWAAEARQAGLPVAAVRTRVVGKRWGCPGCYSGSHR